jgi:hypothetical protein
MRVLEKAVPESSETASRHVDTLPVGREMSRAADDNAVLHVGVAFAPRRTITRTPT